MVGITKLDCKPLIYKVVLFAVHHLLLIINNLQEIDAKRVDMSQRVLFD